MSAPGVWAHAAAGDRESADVGGLASGPGVARVANVRGRVIVTWRRPESLGALLATLGRQSHPTDHLIVVDNDPDPAVAAMVAAFPGPSTHERLRRRPGQ